MNGRVKSGAVPGLKANRKQAHTKAIRSLKSVRSTDLNMEGQAKTMTRLRTEWLENAAEDLKRYDGKLKKLIGMDLSALALRAAAASYASTASYASAASRALSSNCALSAGCAPPPAPVSASFRMKDCKVAVVRVATGEGVIGCFAESVAAATTYMGAETFIPSASDVAGLHEALSAGADILFLADDDRFIALNVKNGIVAENDDATAAGYVAALSAAAGGLSGKEVLLLGLGRLGQKALAYLLAEGASVCIYDCDGAKTTKFMQKIKKSADASTATLGCREGIRLLSARPHPLSGLIFDATNTGEHLGAKDFSGAFLIAAPGMPLSLSDEAYRLYEDRVIHEPLYTGVAVMLAMACAPIVCAPAAV